MSADPVALRPVVMHPDVALGVVRRVRVLEQNVQFLQTRLADREHLLAVALHELALLREVRDPQYFMRVRTHRALRGRKRIGLVSEADHAPIPSKKERRCLDGS
jgi:hypothetical protein